MSTAEARRPAIHEAGHALVAKLVGLPVFSISVDGDGGATRHGYTTGPDDDALLRDHLAVKVGGIAAEYVSGYVRVVRGGPDLKAADALAARLTTDPHQRLQEVATALQLAMALLREHPAALRELAATVARHGAIKGQANVALAINVALAQREDHHAA